MPNFPYTDNVPNPTNNPSVDVGSMQTNTLSIANFLAVDHFGFNNNNGGLHQQVTLINEAAPGIGTGNGVLYANLLNGNSWPIWQNALGSFALMSQASAAGPNGYVSLPAGILLQWGSFTAGGTIPNGQAIGFPFVFPGAVFSVIITGQTASTNDKTINVTQGSVTTSGFTLITSGTSLFKTVNWIAIGN